MTEETLGNKSGQHKEWVSLKMIKKIEEREEKKNRLNTNRIRSSKEIHKEVKKSIRQDKRRYIDNLVQQAEEAAAKEI